MNRISTVKILSLLSIGLNIGLDHSAFAQISDNSLKMSSNYNLIESEHYSSQTIILGKPISKSEFNKIIQYSNYNSDHKPIRSLVDFCVGIIDDEEKALSLEGLNYRQYQDKYAVDQIIFAGKTQNFKVLFDSIVLDKNTPVNHIKTLKAEVMAHAEKGYLVDGFSYHQYPYTSSYSIRKWNQDELIYAYFNAQKLIGLQHIMQC